MSIPEENVAARYTAVPDYWVDMPEANPRARARVAEGTAEVVVDKQGRVHVDGNAGVEIDTYQDPAYESVRKEGEARHA